MSRMRPLPTVAALIVLAVLMALSCSSGPDSIERTPNAASKDPPVWVASAEAPGERALTEENRPSGAMMALSYWGDQRAYPNPTLPDGAFGVALQQVREMRNRKSGGPENIVDPWSPLGPANVGGRTLCLALHPANPDIIFAGSASGGLWKSTTGGVGADAWDRVDTGYSALGVSTIAIDPGDPDVIYIGTGEAYSYQTANGGEAIRTLRGSYGVGILKTTDGGATWSPSLDWTYQQSRGVWMIRIHPTNSSILYAATTEGIYKSTDAGATWDLVHGVIMGMDIRIHPVDPNILFATHGNFGSAGHGIYRSTDAGQTWTRLTSGLPANWNGKAQLAISPILPDTVYASIGDETFGHGLFKSINGGDQWVPINTTDYQQYQGWYSHYVLASPFDANTLLTGGIEIWRSTDGGKTLSQRSNWQAIFMGTSPPEGPIGGPTYAHADHHFAVWHPTDPNTVYFASDGGVFKTTDLGDTFESLIGGYQTSQFYNGFSNSGSDPDFAMGGLQDNFTVIYEGTNAWRREIGGDGSWTAVNTVSDAIIFGSAQFLYLQRSYDAGANWDGVTPPELSGDFTAFIAPYVLAPSTPAVLYAGRSRVYRSDNSGTTWDATNGGIVLSSGNPVLSLAVAPTDPDTAYAGIAPVAGPARVFATTDGGAGWTDVTGSLPDRYPSDIAVDPVDPDTVYVTFMGFGTSHLFRSTDGGSSWGDIGGGLPDLPASAVEVDPDHPEVIYAGTDLGVFISTNAGDSWQPFNNGMPLAMVNDLKAFRPGRLIRAATHGNGAYERPLFEPAGCADADTDGTCDDVDCDPGDSSTWLAPGEVSGLLLSHVGGPAGTTTLSWSAPDPTGASLVRYDTVSSTDPGDFELDPSVQCVESDDGTDTISEDTSVPGSGVCVYFLVRAENACGSGPVGGGPPGEPRLVVDCP